MRFLIMILLSLSFVDHAIAQQDNTYRQSCIDELKAQVDKVCDPATLASKNAMIDMLKNSGFIAEMDSRVKRICSYHCPQDITDKCYALLGKGGEILTKALNGTLDPVATYKQGCTNLNNKITVAKQEIAAMGLNANASANGVGTSSAGKGVNGANGANGAGENFKTRSQNRAPASSGKCNAYNASGQEEIGKCPE